MLFKNTVFVKVLTVHVLVFFNVNANVMFRFEINSDTLFFKNMISSMQTVPRYIGSF